MKRTLNDENRIMVTKIAGAFLLVSGIVLAIPVLLAVIAGVFSLLWFGIKVAVVGGLIYGGWRWIDGSSRRPLDSW